MTAILTAAILAVACIAVFPSCSGRRGASAVLPPETSPLSQEHIGYGVVDALFARLLAEPAPPGATEGAATGHARMGSVARVLERRIARGGGASESWLLIEEIGDGGHSGWIREEMVRVYANEPQARAAAREAR